MMLNMVTNVLINISQNILMNFGKVVRTCNGVSSCNGVRTCNGVSNCNVIIDYLFSDNRQTNMEVR